MEKRKIILDCDPGHDDAIAIMMAAKHPAIDLLGISVYEHCVRVAVMSLVIAELFKITVDRRSLIVGALLHDYFLYDWHKPHGR